LKRLMLVCAITVLLAGCTSAVPATVKPTAAATPASTASSIPPASPLPSPIPPGVTPVPPSGDLLYAAAGAAWIVPAAGGPSRRLGPAIEASWSGDGRLIHLVSQDANCVPRLTTVATSGTVRSVVRSGLRSEDAAFAWSPDGRQIVFARFRNGPPPRSCGSQGGAYTSDESIEDIIVMNADGTGQRILVPKVWPFRPLAWSPDGATIAFASNLLPLGLDTQDVLAVRVRDGALRRLTAPLEGVSAPRWSPDSTMLALTFSDQALGGAEVDVLQIDTGAVQNLGRLGISQQPAWSPDGRWLATMSIIWGSGGGAQVGGAIKLGPIDGGAPRDLGVTDVENLSDHPWSSDGEWLAYVRQAGGGEPLTGIAIASADGSSSKAVADTAGAEWVAWQPGP
jgi:Tol biopolymer transport system component